MKDDNPTKAIFSTKGCAESVIIMGAIGALAWMFPLLCKGWLSISPENFYVKYTALFILCAVWPIAQSIKLLYSRAKIISKGIKAALCTVFVSDIIALLFMLVPSFVIEADYKLGGFYHRYGLVYVVCMLISALFGIVAIIRRKKKAEAS